MMAKQATMGMRAHIEITQTQITVSKVILCLTLLYEEAVRKMLMKFTKT